jgi:hypothetical protein
MPEQPQQNHSGDSDGQRKREGKSKSSSASSKNQISNPPRIVYQVTAKLPMYIVAVCFRWRRLEGLFTG